MSSADSIGALMRKVPGALATKPVITVGVLGGMALVVPAITRWAFGGSNAKTEYPDFFIGADGKATAWGPDFWAHPRLASTFTSLHRFQRYAPAELAAAAESANALVRLWFVALHSPGQVHVSDDDTRDAHSYASSMASHLTRLCAATESSMAVDDEITMAAIAHDIRNQAHACCEQIMTVAMEQKTANPLAPSPLSHPPSHSAPSSSSAPSFHSTPAPDSTPSSSSSSSSHLASTAASASSD